MRSALQAAARALRRALRGVGPRQGNSVLCPRPVPVVVRRRAR
jgi:hypothetical protein